MDSERISEVRNKVRAELLRSRILYLLEEAYPAQQHSDLLLLELQKGTDVGLRAFIRELHYLKDKGLVQLDEIFPDRYLARITVRGRDVLTGHVKEVGLFHPTRSPF